MLGGGAIGIIIRALFPPLVGLLYQIPLAAAVAWIALRPHVRDREKEEALWPLVGLIGAGGPVLMFIVARLPLPAAPLLALIAHWVGVSLLLDHYLDAHFDESYALTGPAVLPMWLLSVIVGGAVVALSA
ncbi:MAG: hypothetical protein GF393_01320 [Armatimonadia bacterium]|nr:hypothetical protein [Armatimonadia bacterium]